VKKTIETTISQRDDETKAKKDALGKLDKSQKDLASTRTTLTNTTKTLTATTTALAAANRKAQDLDTQITNLNSKLAIAVARGDTNEAQLAKWEQVHLTPQQVLEKLDDLKKVTLARDGVEEEKKVLQSNLKADDEELARLRGTNHISDIPQLPAGLKGQVLAVDPKYGFVVLDIGGDKGVKTNGIMMVARDGNLIGKVQISSVNDTQSVANILPAWRHGEVMEGDEVLY
jgi:hypothetical protein